MVEKLDLILIRLVITDDALNVSHHHSQYIDEWTVKYGNATLIKVEFFKTTTMLRRGTGHHRAELKHPVLLCECISMLSRAG